MLNGENACLNNFFKGQEGNTGNLLDFDFFKVLLFMTVQLINDKLPPMSNPITGWSVSLWKVVIA